MKIFSKGRTEYIDQAGSKIWHMGHDFDIDNHDITIECDLSLPQNTNRKYSMMSSLNEEMFNASKEFNKRVTLFDRNMEEVTYDGLYYIVTTILNDAIDRLNEKGEPMWSVIVKKKKDKKKDEIKKEVESPINKDESKMDIIEKEYNGIDLDDNAIGEYEGE